MYTTHHPCWDAKNRHSLPEVMDLDYSNIAHIFTGAEKKPSPLDMVRKNMQEAQISETELMAFIAAKGHYLEAKSVRDYPEKFITGWILHYWNQVVDGIRNKNTDK